MRHQPAAAHAGPTSQFAKLLDAERRLGEELDAAHRRAQALLDAIRLGIEEHQARWTLVLSKGFPDVQRGIAEQRVRTIAELTASARRDAARYDGIAETEIDRLADEVVDRLLGDA